MITGGTGIGQMRAIRANDANTLTVDRPWLIQPDATSSFGIVGGAVVECLHLGNEFYNCHGYSGVFGSGVRSVWVNEIYENVSQGLALWAIEGASVQYLNLAYGEKFNSRAGVALYNRRRTDATTQEDRAAEMQLVKVFGNEIRGCSIRERSYVSSENGMIWNGTLRDTWASKGVSAPLHPVPGTEPAITIYDHPPAWAGVPTDPVLDTYASSSRWNLLTENQIVRCPVGILLGKAVDRTILSGNTFYETPTPITDLARNTMNRNSFVSEGGKPVP
jgi:hypothetical protein